jgi:excisionase family DNA binding protein
VGAKVETYLTIEELAHYLKVAEQTIRRWVLNREIPFCKIKKVIRFRLSEIEKWVSNSGVLSAAVEVDEASGGLFDKPETETDGGGGQ